MTPFSKKYFYLCTFKDPYISSFPYYPKTSSINYQFFYIMITHSILLWQCLKVKLLQFCYIPVFRYFFEI